MVWPTCPMPGDPYQIVGLLLFISPRQRPPKPETRMRAHRMLRAHLCYIAGTRVAYETNPCLKPARASMLTTCYVLNGLIEQFGSTGNGRRIFRSGNIHIPVDKHNHVNREKRGHCFACQGLRFGQVRQRKPLSEASANSLNARKAAPNTRWGCDTCDVPICQSRGCWYFYHSVGN